MVQHFSVQRRRWQLLAVSLLALAVSGCAATGSVPAPAATTAVAALAPTAAPAAPSAAAPTSPPIAPTEAPAATAAPPPTAEPATAAPTATVEPTPAPPTAVPLQAFDPQLAAELQRILDQTVADGFIPGAVLAVTIPGQEPWTGASGVADRGGRVPMDPSTRVRIASISKMFTAVTVLKLAEEGALDLDAPMSTWLPDLVPNAGAITVRSLLNHTTGLYDYLEDRRFVNEAYRAADRVWAPEELVAYATQFPPSFPAGAAGAWDYSSTNYVILGMIVERATGTTLAEQVRRIILEPLGLQSTFSANTEPIEGVMSRGYSNNIDQTNAPMSFVFGTANIVSTAADVMRFSQALHAGELLQPESLEVMYSFQDGKGQYNMPDLAYGLGVMRHRLPVGGQHPAEASTVLGHIGGYGGFRSAVWTSPASGITIALGVNQAATDPNKLAARVWDAVLAAQAR